MKYELKETTLLRLENEELVKRIKELKVQINELKDLCEKRKNTTEKTSKEK